jgi:7-cyano-7-deazaguanine synthase
MSGGLDSSLAAVLGKDAGVEMIPLFIDYGQRARERERDACEGICGAFGLPPPVVMDLSGFGSSIPSGLTDPSARIREDAFLPGRNLLFLVAAAALAYSRGASGIVIGLLDEDQRLFPDQSKEFVDEVERVLESALGYRVAVHTPLIDLTKTQVLALASERGIVSTYSCHAGGSEPCGRCVSCLELDAAIRLRGDG